MWQFICPNCSSRTYHKKDGNYVCDYCDTVFTPTANDPKAPSIIELDKDVQRLLEKCRQDPKNAKKLAGLVLDLDPTNEEALSYLNNRR